MREVKKWLKGWLYVPKRAESQDKSFSRIMCSSVLGVLICTICLAGLTWAWFSSSATSTASAITAADFSVTATVQDSSGTEVEPSGGSYLLGSGTYTVTVTAGGTASTGYCHVLLGEDRYRTVQLYTNEEDGTKSVTFTVSADAETYLTITPQWGTYAGTADEPLIGGDGLSGIPAGARQTALPSAANAAPGEPANRTYALTDTEQSYTVQQGDTLSGIAERFGTTVDVLSAYNNIRDSHTIHAGVTIKIPPASYEIPEADANGSTEQTQGSSSDTGNTPGTGSNAGGTASGDNTAPDADNQQETNTHEASNTEP